MSKLEKEEVIDIADEGEEGDEYEEEEPLCPPFDMPPSLAFLLDDTEEQFTEADLKISRPFKLALNLLQGPHGSVKLSQGDTTVICAVYGPTEIRVSKELPHRAAVDVLYRPKIIGGSSSHNQDMQLEERSIECKLAPILESVLFLEEDAGAGFNVIFQEIEDDGGLFPTLVNASALALLSAGVSLRSSFAAVSILFDETRDQIVVDPCKEQIEEMTAPLLMVDFVISSDGHVLHTNSRGRMSKKQIRLGLRQALVASKEIFQLQKQIVGKELGDFFNELNLNEIKIKEEEEEEKDEIMQLE